MKHFILFSFLTLATFEVYAKDAPCHVDLYKSQGQFNKAIQQPGDKNLSRITNQKNLTLPEVMAKADRFKIVKNLPEEQVVIHKVKSVNDDSESDATDTASKLGGMFHLLVPAKLRNPSH